MKIFGVTGWKNSGKTGLMERLITEFTARGLSVSSIKHAHHSFDIDHPGRDSYRHRDAGAQQVLLASRNRWALMHELRDEDEPSLGDLLKQLSPVDLVLIEGYKRDRHPKIEAHRKETGQPLIAPEDETIVAVASDTLVTIDRPVLELNDTASIANFIAQHLELDV
jgi:molybdopterin-guanine dinucleotide biosynthesis protein MobB